MATEKIGIEVEVKGAEKSISSFKDLKTAIKAAKDEQIAMTEKFGSTSIEAINATKKLSELKDKVDDLNDSSKSLKGTGFEMLKQGFGQVREGLMNLDFDKVKTGLTAMSSGFVSMGKAAMSSLQGIKGAIAATGIGLLVVALGTIYAYWDDIKGVVDGLTPELKKQNDLANENLKTQQDKLNAISGQENILKLQGKTEKEILQLKIKQTDEAIIASDIAIAQAEQTKIAQVEASKRNKDILQGIIAFVTAPLSATLKGIDAIGSAFGKNFGLYEGFTGGIAKMVFDPDEVATEGDKVIAEAKAVNAKLKNDRAGLQLSINAIDTKAVEDDKKANDSKVQNSKDAAKQKLLIELELQGRLKELQTELIYDEREKEEKILENKYVAERKSLVSKGANNETLKALDELYLKQKGDITDKYLQKENDKAINIINKTKEINANLIEDEEQKAFKILEIKNKLDRDILLNTLQRNEETNVLTEESNNLLIAFDKQYLKQKGDLEKKYAAENKKIKQAEFAQNLENIKNGLQSAQNLSDLYFTIKSAKVKKGSKEEEDLARKQFDINKKLNLAMATINGVQAIQAILATAVDPTGITTALRIAASATLSAVNIAKIATAQFEGGGGTPTAEAPTSIPSAPTSQAPSIYGPGQGQSTTFSGNQNNNFAPVKAYVVETENRSTTNRVNKLVSESTYG